MLSLATLCPTDWIQALNSLNIPFPDALREQVIPISIKERDKKNRETILPMSNIYITVFKTKLIVIGYTY